MNIFQQQKSKVTFKSVEHKRQAKRYCVYSLYLKADELTCISAVHNNKLKPRLRTPVRPAKK